MTNITPPAMNIAHRLQQIAASLGKLFLERAGCLTEIEGQQAEYDARLDATVTPPAWAAGKTVDDKKNLVKAAEASDEILGQMRANLREMRAHLADYEAQIAALEAERRGLEWTVRADMAKAIGGRQGAGDNGQSEDHGAPDAQLETVAWDETVFALADGEIYGDTLTAEARQPESAYLADLEF